MIYIIWICKFLYYIYPYSILLKTWFLFQSVCFKDFLSLAISGLIFYSSLMVACTLISFKNSLIKWIEEMFLIMLSSIIKPYSFWWKVLKIHFYSKIPNFISILFLHKNSGFATGPNLSLARFGYICLFWFFFFSKIQNFLSLECKFINAVFSI